MKNLKLTATQMILWAFKCNATANYYDEDTYDVLGNDKDEIRKTCVVKEALWKICKECDPSYGDSKECHYNPTTECKCMNIIINGQGKSLVLQSQ